MYSGQYYSTSKSEMSTLVRQMPFGSDHAKAVRQYEIEKYYKGLTDRGRTVYHERVHAFNTHPRDPKFIRCTFVPGLGWDMTEREAVQFIQLLDGHIVSTVEQPALECMMHESDSYDYLWIGFE